MSKKIKFILLVSIFLNLFFAGMFFGRFFKEWQRGHEPEGRGFGHHMQIIEKDLSADARQSFHNAMQEVLQNEPDLESQFNQAREKIFSILQDEKFDPQKYRQAVKDLHALHEKRVLGFAETISMLVEKFSLDDRQILARHLRRQDDRRPPSPEKP